MQTATHRSAATLASRERRQGRQGAPTPQHIETGTVSATAPPSPAFVSLDRETRAAVDTSTAAYHLNRKPQTLRGWACHEDGPLRPVRVHGRLAWRTADLRALLGVS